MLLKSFEEIFETPKLNKIELYRQYKAYEVAKEKDRVEDFMKEENLTDVDIELHFKELLSDDKIIENKMSILTLNDRKKLSDEWDAIGENDYEAQFKFIEEHNLWGACPNIFEFTNEELSMLAEDF